jgi:hypothetical protein
LQFSNKVGPQQTLAHETLFSTNLQHGVHLDNANINKIEEMLVQLAWLPTSPVTTALF